MIEHDLINAGHVLIPTRTQPGDERAVTTPTLPSPLSLRSARSQLHRCIREREPSSHTTRTTSSGRTSDGSAPMFCVRRLSRHGRRLTVLDHRATDDDDAAERGDDEHV